MKDLNSRIIEKLAEEARNVIFNLNIPKGRYTSMQISRGMSRKQDPYTWSKRFQKEGFVEFKLEVDSFKCSFWLTDIFSILAQFEKSVHEPGGKFVRFDVA